MGLSWINNAIKKFENCQIRKMSGCDGCRLAHIRGVCINPHTLISMRSDGIRGIGKKSIEQMEKEKEEIVKRNIREILNKPHDDRNWIERRYLELWLLK